MIKSFPLLQSLLESFQPSYVPFGTNDDMDDGNIYNIKGYYLTFFEQNGIYYSVSISKTTNDVGLGSSPVKTFAPLEYDNNRKLTRNALKIFNNFMFVALDMAERGNINQLKFKAANPELNQIYNKLISNKFSLQSIQNAGWKFSEKMGDDYIFEKN